MRILLVEDEKRVASFVRRGLAEQHYTVDLAEDGEQGQYLAETHPYDLIILDVMLPKMDGFAVCRALRAHGVDAPILFLTARDSITDKVQGLEGGADDYLVKPFAFQELLARVRVLLRRKSPATPSVLKVADLELNQVTHKVTRGGQAIDLTSTEYSLLEYLLLNAHQIVTRTMISEHVWHHDFDSFSNVINVYINYLRNKVDRGFDRQLIHSIRGSGYLIKE